MRLLCILAKTSLLVMVLLSALPARASVSAWLDVEIIGGHIHVPITVQDVQGTAILDSGAELHAINTNLINTERFGAGASVKLAGAYADDKLPRRTVNDVPITLFGTSLKLDGFAEVDLGQSALVILGQPFFDAFVLQIDYPNSRMRIMDRKAVKLHKEKNIRMKKVEGGLPLVQVTVEGQKTWLTLDTGNSSGILMNRGFAEHKGWLEQFPAIATAGEGMVSAAKLISFQVPEVQFGPFTVEQALVSVPDKGYNLSQSFNKRLSKTTGTNIKQKTSKGLLGYDIVKHFVLTVDYKNAVMHVGLPEG